MSKYTAEDPSFDFIWRWNHCKWGEMLLAVFMHLFQFIRLISGIFNEFYVSSKFFNCSPFSHFFSWFTVHYFSAILAFNTIIRFIEALNARDKFNVYLSTIDWSRSVVLSMRCDSRLSYLEQLENRNGARENLTPGLHLRDPLWSLSRSDPSRRGGGIFASAPPLQNIN